MVQKLENRSTDFKFCPCEIANDNHRCIMLLHLQYYNRMLVMLVVTVTSVGCERRKPRLAGWGQIKQSWILLRRLPQSGVRLPRMGRIRKVGAVSPQLKLPKSPAKSLLSASHLHCRRNALFTAVIDYHATSRKRYRGHGLRQATTWRLALNLNGLFEFMRDWVSIHHSQLSRGSFQHRGRGRIA